MLLTTNQAGVRLLGMNAVNVIDSSGKVMNAFPSEGVDREYGEWLAQDNANVFGETFTVVSLKDGSRKDFTPVQGCEEPRS